MPTTISNETEPNRDEWIVATVRFINLEGGFFGLICTDHTRLLPLNLDSTCALDGAKIKIQGHKCPETLTIQQWGTPFTITQIELIERGRESVNSMI